MREAARYSNLVPQYFIRYLMLQVDLQEEGAPNPGAYGGQENKHQSGECLIQLKHHSIAAASHDNANKNSPPRRHGRPRRLRLLAHNRLLQPLRPSTRLPAKPHPFQPQHPQLCLQLLRLQRRSHVPRPAPSDHRKRHDREHGDFVWAELGERYQGNLDALPKGIVRSAKAGIVGA